MTVSLRRFVFFSALFVGGSILLTTVGAFEPLQALTASASGAVAAFLGAPTTVLDSSIVTATGTIDVVDACLPIGMAAVFSALVLSTETTNGRRLMGLAGVLTIVLAANVMRVTAAILAAQVGAAFFSYVHSGPLQMLPEALLFIPWLVWSRAEHRKAALSFAGYVVLLALGLSFAWPAISSAYAHLRMVALEPYSTASAGLQPLGSSPWLVTGVAVLVAAKVSLRKRASAVALLLAGVVVADLLLTVASLAVGFDQSLLRSTLTLMAPLVAVVLFVGGRLSMLWSGDDTAMPPALA